MKLSSILTSIVLAASHCNLALGTTKQFNASFDDLPAIPEEGRLSPVGIYQQISYENFDLSDPAIAVAGVRPHSTPNYIFGVGTASSPAAQTVVYKDSPLRSLSLKSLYYGCQTNLGQAAASVPVSCTITATGFRAGKQVAKQDFKYSPAKGLFASLAFGEFNAAFRGLTNVTYAQSPSTLTEFLFDNIVGTTTS
ncbi:hypothetical protein ACLMJK_007034 [Lecanora helva]